MRRPVPPAARIYVLYYMCACVFHAAHKRKHLLHLTRARVPKRAKTLRYAVVATHVTNCTVCFYQLLLLVVLFFNIFPLSLSRVSLCDLREIASFRANAPPNACAYVSRGAAVATNAMLRLIGVDNNIFRAYSQMHTGMEIVHCAIRARCAHKNAHKNDQTQNHRKTIVLEPTQKRALAVAILNAYFFSGMQRAPDIVCHRGNGGCPAGALCYQKQREIFVLDLFAMLVRCCFYVRWLLLSFRVFIIIHFTSRGNKKRPPISR